MKINSNQYQVYNFNHFQKECFRPTRRITTNTFFSGNPCKQSDVLKLVKDVSLGAAAILAIPLLFFAPAYLTTRYDEIRLEKKYAKEREIEERVSELAKPEVYSVTYLSGLIDAAIENEPMFFKEKYWEEQVSLLAQKAVKHFTDVEAGIRENVRQAQKADYEHRMYIKDLINTDDEMQQYLQNSKKAELAFNRQNPNKKVFETYYLNYSDCSGFVSGIINQIGKIPLENNAKMVKIGTKQVTRNVPSGVQTRFGVDLLRTETKSEPIYKKVYPKDIISFASNNEELQRIEIRCYKK